MKNTTITGRRFGRTAKAKNKINELIKQGYEVSRITKKGVHIMIKS